MMVASYVSRVAEKLRREQLAATVLTGFVMTNSFKDTPQYSNALALTLPVATEATPERIRYGLQGIQSIYREGYQCKKAEVMLTGLVPASQVQAKLFDSTDCIRSQRLMSALDAINDRWGRGTLHSASSGIAQEWKAQFPGRSPGTVAPYLSSADNLHHS
jgi:DNA polymerase V